MACVCNYIDVVFTPLFTTLLSPTVARLSDNRKIHLRVQERRTEVTTQSLAVQRDTVVIVQVVLRLSLLLLLLLLLKLFLLLKLLLKLPLLLHLPFKLLLQLLLLLQVLLQLLLQLLL